MKTNRHHDNFSVADSTSDGQPTALLAEPPLQRQPHWSSLLKVNFSSENRHTLPVAFEVGEERGTGPALALALSDEWIA